TSVDTADTSVRATGIALFSLLLLSCGYHVSGSGRATLLPKNIQTIAIPAFGNASTQYKVSDRLTAAITREFIERTRYQITADTGNADAVLTGAVTNFLTYPTIYDPATQRAAGVQVILFLQVSLRDKSGAVLFNRPNMDVRERYEISVDPKVYFDESETALDRLSRDAARTIVSAILENF
ncbi:MAG: LPS assembly lipoprotein LptE, partial [Bryobacteraceae bacterium]